MKSAGVRSTLSLLALAAFTSPLALADDAGWYGGFGIGESRARYEEQKIASEVLGPGFNPTVTTRDKHGVAWKLFGGYQFNRYLALEGGYFDLGEFDFRAGTVPPGTLSGNLKFKGVNLDLVGFLPVTERFSAFARGGATYTQARANFAGTGAASAPANPSRKEREAGYKAGVGLEYKASQALAMRAEAELYRLDDAVSDRATIRVFSAGLLYRFGGAAAPAAVAAAESTAMPAEPETPPATVTPAGPAKVTFSANVLFDFDRATLRPEGKQALNKLAADLKQANYDVVTVKAVTAVTGHTDRIGTHDYNVRLSNRRAEAVKNYLVNVAGIPAGKVVTRGVNSDEPMTKPGDCPGDKVTAELISCLQPDRRVDVQISESQ